MAYISCDFHSKALDMETTLSVILPENTTINECNVVTMLHGLGQNNTSYIRNCPLERYSKRYKLAIVIPQVQRSFYTDMRVGLPYFTYVSKELREACSRFFNLSTKREMNYIMGLSMGGYGALKIAYSNPDNYIGCASFSGVTDIYWSFNRAKGNRRKEYDAIFGTDVPKDADIYYLLDNIKSEPPTTFLSCGDDDIRLNQTIDLGNKLKAMGVKVEVEHFKGDHDWLFWDEAIKNAFRYFFES